MVCLIFWSSVNSITFLCLLAAPQYKLYLYRMLTQLRPKALFMGVKMDKEKELELYSTCSLSRSPFTECNKKISFNLCISNNKALLYVLLMPLSMHSSYPSSQHLSVSDIEEVKNGESAGFYFCDSIGFKKVPFHPEQTQKADNLIRILVVEPHRKPY